MYGLVLVDQENATWICYYGNLMNFKFFHSSTERNRFAPAPRRPPRRSVVRIGNERRAPVAARNRENCSKIVRADEIDAKPWWKCTRPPRRARNNVIVLVYYRTMIRFSTFSEFVWRQADGRRRSSTLDISIMIGGGGGEGGIVRWN